MKTALITGTTSGIGKAFAERSASMGNNIILVSRNEEKLKKQKNALRSQYHVEVRYIACDLTQTDAVDLIINKIDRWQISVDLLINNAGFNECGLYVLLHSSQNISYL